MLSAIPAALLLGVGGSSDGQRNGTPPAPAPIAPRPSDSRGRAARRFEGPCVPMARDTAVAIPDAMATQAGVRPPSPSPAVSAPLSFEARTRTRYTFTFDDAGKIGLGAPVRPEQQRKLRIRRVCALRGPRGRAALNTTPCRACDVVSKDNRQVACVCKKNMCLHTRLHAPAKNRLD